MNTPYEFHNYRINKSPLFSRSHYSVLRPTKQLIAMFYYSAMKFGKKNINFLNHNKIFSNKTTLDHVTTLIGVIMKK